MDVSKRKKLVDKVFKKYRSMVNMSYSELLKWSKTKLSRRASLNRKPIFRNLRLLSKPKEKWNKNDIKQAFKVISYLSRAKKIKRAKGYKRKEYTPNEIALKNWGYDIIKK